MSDASSTADPFDLIGRVAAVTGGNGGIGLAMARGLAGRGATVVIVGRDTGKLARAEESLVAAGATVAILAADVTTEDGCAAVTETCRSRFGRLDILVNNAGTNVRKAPESYGLDEWHALIDANLTSAFLMSKAALPLLRVRGGKIINVGSMTSLFGAPFAAPYSAAKGGVVQLTRALASAWAGHGIQVNAILPGWIETDLTDGLKRDVPAIEARVTARTPAGRWGRPDDLAGAAVFLASPASDFVTGVALPVDGGYAAQA
jgi:2-deoxy-D-gluconate 3-dehydrogenase